MQGKQAVLHVHTNTHLLGAAQEDAHITVSHLLEQGFPAFTVVVVHNGYLVGGYAGGYQLFLHIFIEVEAGNVRVVIEQIHLGLFARRLVAVAEHKLCTLVRRAFLIELDDVAHNLVCLAVGVVRIVRVQQAQVNGCLLGLGEQDKRQGTLLAFGLPGQLVVFLQLTHQHIHHVLQVLVLVNDDVFHFPVCQLGNVLVLPELLHILRQHHVGMTAESFQQFGHVDIALEAVGNLEVARGRELQRRLHRAERGGEVIKAADVIGFQYVRRNEIHHRPHLGHRVGDRRAGSQDDIAPSVLLLHPAGFQEQTVGALRGTRIHPFHVVHLGGKAYFLEVVRLVDK